VVGTDEESITGLLHEMVGSEPGATERLLEAVYQPLRGLARRQRRRIGDGAALATTELVHEAYFRLFPARRGWADREHFFATAARAMRQILINAAEARRAAKRGGGSHHLDLAAAGEALAAQVEQDRTVDELLALEHALRRLEQRSPRQGRVVECRFFAGLDVDETAAALGISPATVKRDWSLARAWLYRELGAKAEEPRGGGAA